MAEINLGAIKFNWKGAYNNSTAYVVDDVVSSGGSSYVCILASQGNAVTNGTYWNIMAQVGTNGTNGTNGTDLTSTLTAQGDILYRDGSGLAKLGAGTSGQLLKTGGSGANPSWINAPVGGLGQYKYFSFTSPFSLASNGFSNYETSGNGLDLTMTPTSASSKFRISFSTYGEIPVNNRGWGVRIVKTVGGSDTTVFEEADQKGVYHNGASILFIRQNHFYYDNPNTTSAVTYRVQVRQDGGGQINYNKGSNPSFIELMEINV